MLNKFIYTKLKTTITLTNDNIYHATQYARQKEFNAPADTAWFILVATK